MQLLKLALPLAFVSALVSVSAAPVQVSLHPSSCKNIRSSSLIPSLGYPPLPLTAKTRRCRFRCSSPDCQIIRLRSE